MANLRKRILKLQKLRGSVAQKGINALDIFLVGALTGLYSKKLLIEQEVSGKTLGPDSLNNTVGKSQQANVSEVVGSDHSEKLKSVSTADRLSKSVSDYVLKLEKQDYNDYAKGFYTGQLDNIAKIFATPVNDASLAEVAKRGIESIERESEVADSIAQQGDSIGESSVQAAREGQLDITPDEIEKASGNENKEPSYQEILDTFRKGLDSDSVEGDESVQKESDTLKTARSNNDFFSSEKSSEESDNNNAEQNSQSAKENTNETKDGHNNVDLAQAEVTDSNQSPTDSSSSPSPGGEAAANASSSVFGSIGMVPAAVMGLSLQQVISKTLGNDPVVSLEPTEPEEVLPQPGTPIVEEPIAEEPIVVPVVPDSGNVSTPVIAAAPEPVLAFQGRVVDGYVVGATVFYDENNNGILDDSESGYVGVTDADGNFQLPDFSAANQSGSVVVLPGGVDTNTGHKIGAMQVNVPKDAEGNPILSDVDSPDAQAAISSPLTLILAQNTDIVEADLIAQLGMNGVEEKGLAFYDPVSEMQAGNNNSLAEYVFTIQQQLFSVIQAGSKIAGEAAGLSALEVSVRAVGDAMKTALENGTAITVDGISDSAIATVANASGFSSLASNFASIVKTTNQKIAEGYSGMALALSDPTNEDSITLLSNARATAAASQDTLLSTIETSLSSGTLDTAAFSTALNSVISENSAIFGTVLQAEAGDGSSGLSEFGNPAFIVTKLLEQTGVATRDIVDLSSSINSLSLAQLSQLGVAHVRLLGSNTAVEISMGNVTDAILSALNDDATVDDAQTTLVDESSVDDGLFASNYTVTLKVTDDQVASVVANATALNAAGIDVIKPVEGTLTLTLAEVRNLQSLGFEFASGLVRFSATTADSLTFDEIYTLLNTGLKLTDASQVSVSIPEGDSRSTFSTIKDLASRGVSFDGGTITLTQDDLKGSFSVLQSQLLDAAKSNIVFDTGSVSSWSLGKAGDGTTLGSPSIAASDINYLVNAGITFNNATVNVTDTADVTTIVSNAFEILSAGVRNFNFSSGVSISTSDARTILDAKDLTIEQGTTYSNVIFSGEGVLSNLGSASLQSLSDFLAEGLGLDTSFVPQYSDALALVQLGITFPQGITLQSSEETTVTQSDASTLVAAGVKFQGSFNISYSKDAGLTEAENLSAVSNLIMAGLKPVSSDGGKITISGTNSNPLYIRPTEWNALKDYVDLENASLVLTRSSDFATAFGDLTDNQLFWETQTQFSKFAVPLSVTPVYSQLKTLADLNVTRSSGDGTTPIAIVRVAKSSDSFTELNTNISIRMSSQADLDAVNVESLKNSGVDLVDVLGVPLSVAQIQKFLSANAPVLENAKLLINNQNVSDAATLLQQSFDRTIFDAGVSGFGVASGTSTTADVWKTFSDAYDNLSGDSNSASTRIFDGGVITGAGGLTSGVGQVLDRLGRAGLKLAETYSPSLTEVREYIDSGGSYSKGIKIGLQDGETLGPNEAIALAQANVSFTANTPLDFTGQTANTLLNASSDTEQVLFFQKLIDKGFLLQNINDDLKNLNGVTISQDVFELLNSKGFNFTNSKVQITNKMELVSAAVKIASTENHGITHLQVPEDMVPSFGQAKLLLGAGLSFEMISSDGGSVTDLGATIKAASITQLESLARQIDSLEKMGVSSFDLEGLAIPVNVAKIFAQAAATSNINFLNQPELLISADDNLFEVPEYLADLSNLGVREIVFEDNVPVNAKAAYDIVQTTDQIIFKNGFISESEGVAEDQLKNVLAELKVKGMALSPSFKPTMGFELVDNSQSDSDGILAMITDGYRVDIQPVTNDSGELSNPPLSNVFLSIQDIQKFADKDNFSDSLSQPRFTNSFLVAKNSQELNTISSDLQLENSGILALGVDRIAIQGNLSPALSHIQQAGANGLTFSRVNNVDGQYEFLSGEDGLITLKVEQNNITEISENGPDILASGIKRLNLFGKEIDVSVATQLVESGFIFEGGKIASIANPEMNTITHLSPLANAGLGLPDDVTVKDSTISLDFALNRFKGSLEGASIDLSNRQEDEAIDVNQMMRLVNRDLGVGLSETSVAFFADNADLPVQLKLSTSNELTETTAQKVVELGFNQIIGEVNPKSSTNLITETTLDLTGLKIKGRGAVEEVIAIIDSGKGNLLDGVTISGNANTNLSVTKKLLTIDSLHLNLDALVLSEETIAPDDFLEISNRIVVSDSTVITGTVTSIEDALTLGNLTNNLNGNVLLKNETIPIVGEASDLVNIVNSGMTVFDGINPTAIIQNPNLSVEEALVLGGAGLNLAGYVLAEGQSANIHQAVQLLSYESLGLENLKIEREEQLQSTAKANISSLKQKGVLFQPSDSEKLFTIDETQVGPLEALDLDAIGADLSGKKVDVDGLVIPDIAIALKEIDGLDLANILTSREGLSAQQIFDLEERGVRVDQQLEVLAEQSEFSGNIEEESLVDPVGTGFRLVADGSVVLRNDSHSTYDAEVISNNDGFTGRFDVTFVQTEDSEIQKLDWSYSLLAEQLEGMSEGENLAVNYEINLTENFLGVVKEDVAQLDIEVNIAGTNDQPEIFFETIDDTDVLIRDGQSDIANGSLSISERDLSDNLSIAIEIPQSVIKKDGVIVNNESIDVPINFVLKNAQSGDVLWEHSQEDNFYQEGDSSFINVRPDSIEVIGPELSAGEFELEWSVSGFTEIFSNLEDGAILESDYVLKVSDLSGESDQSNNVQQNISVDFQSNSRPSLVGTDGLAPQLSSSGTEDQVFGLTPDNFGYDYFVDPDGDLFKNFEIVSISEDISLFYSSRTTEFETDFRSLPDQINIGLENTQGVASFVLENNEIDLFVRPDQDINGTRYLDFKVGDGVKLSDEIYTSSVFFGPVVDAPKVQIRRSEIIGDTDDIDLEFVKDDTSVQFEIISQGQNSEILNAELSIEQDGVVIHNKQLSEGERVTDYNFSIESISQFMGSVDNDDFSQFIITNPVEANIVVVARDLVEDVDHSEIFEIREQITIIPDGNKIKNDIEYRTKLFGESHGMQQPSSNFSEFATSDDTTFIDPSFGRVLSTDTSISGALIDYDSNTIIGSKGDDFIFARSDTEKEVGTLVHGGEGFDDLSGGDYGDIIYLDFNGNKGEDKVYGGLGDDIFVIENGGDMKDADLLVVEDTSKQDMNERLENLLIQDSIPISEIVVAGIIEDFSVAKPHDDDSIVLSGFSENAEYTVHSANDMAVLLVEDDANDKLFTAAILMPEYGTFDSSDMDLMNDAIHKI